VNALMDRDLAKPEHIYRREKEDMILSGREEIIESLLKNEKMRSSFDHHTLVYASETGRIRVVEMILTYTLIDPSERDDEAMRKAIQNGHVDIALMLSKDHRTNPSSMDNWTLNTSVERGYVRVVEMILNHPNTILTSRDHVIMVHACRWGCEDIVRLLLNDERIDPTYDDNHPIKMAIFSRKQNIVSLLLDDIRVWNTIYRYDIFIMSVAYDLNGIVSWFIDHDIVDPSANDNEALVYATIYNRDRSVKTLLKDSRVRSRLIDYQDNMSLLGRIPFAPLFPKIGDRIDKNLKYAHPMYISCFLRGDDVFNVFARHMGIEPSVGIEMRTRVATQIGHVRFTDAMIKRRKTDHPAYDDVSMICTSVIDHVKMIDILIGDMRSDSRANMYS
jgi:hypothetical protein